MDNTWIKFTIYHLPFFIVISLFPNDLPFAKMAALFLAVPNRGKPTPSSGSG